MRIVLFLLLGLCVAGLKARQPADILNRDSIHVKLVQKLLLQELKDFRSKKFLPAFIDDDSLYNAANDQAQYCARRNELTDYQSQPEKYSVKSRVAFYNGDNKRVGENCMMISLPHGAVVNRDELYTYEKLAHRIFQSFADKKSPYYQNIIKRDFVKSALAIALSRDKNSLYVVQVLSAEHFKLPDGMRLYGHGPYGVKESDPALCRYYSKYEYLTQVLSTYLRIKGDSVFLYFPRKRVIDTLIRGPRDGFALDLVCKTQFNCDGPNFLDPSPVYDGYMLPPVYREELYKNNRRHNGEFLSFLGVIPPDAPFPSMQVNLIMIQDEMACRYSFPLSFEWGKLPDLPIEPMWCETSGVIKSGEAKFTRQFAIPFQKNDKTTDSFYFEKLSRLVKIFDGAISKIEIKAYSSVEGTKVNNLELQIARADFLEKFMIAHMHQKVLFEKKAFENWTLFHQQIKGTPYEKEFADSTAQVRALVNARMNEPALWAMLNEQRVASITIYVDKIYDDHVPSNLLPLVVFNGIMQGDTLQAQIAYSRMIEAFKRGEIDRYFLTAIEVPLQNGNLPLINNYLASVLMESDVFRYHNFSRRYYEYIDSAKNMYSWFKPLAFNLAVYKTHLYLRDMADDTIDFRKLGSEVLAFSHDAGINPELSKHLLFNYYLTASIYYDKLRMFDAADSAFNNFKPMLNLADLQPAEVYEIGKYFNFFRKMKETITLLENYIDKYPEDENLAYLYVSTGSIYNLLLDYHIDEYYRQIDKLARLNKEKLNIYFNYNYQLTRSDVLKEKYCRYCTLDYGY